MRCLAVAVTVACFAPMSTARAGNASSALVRAMTDEAQRSLSLSLSNAAKPYIVSFVVQDTELFTAHAEFGGLLKSTRKRTRFARADVRVGDYVFDDSGFASGGFSSAPGAVVGLSVDNDYAVLRRQLWLAADSAYKSAVARFEKKRAALAGELGDSKRVADFTREPPQVTIGKPAAIPIDEPALRKLVTQLSAMYWKYPDIQEGDVALAVKNTIRYVVSTEGTKTIAYEPLVTLTLYASTQAASGASLTRRIPIVANALSAMEPAPMRARLDAMLRELSAARTAAAAQLYSGPVLFEGVAAAQLVERRLALSLSGTPPAKGEADPGGASLRQWFGKRVLPKGFRVVDDPTMTRFASVGLVGHYAADSEGVPAQRVELVKDGILTALLMSRKPSKRQSRSNGHGRGGLVGGISGKPGNLVLTSKRMHTRAQLTKMLLKAARAAGETYAIVVRRLADRTSAGQGQFAVVVRASSAAGAEPLAAAVAVRLNPDGSEVPLRGVEVRNLSTRTLRRLVAAGGDMYVHNVSSTRDELGLGSTPYSVVTPALLIDDVDVVKSVSTNRRLPVNMRPSRN